jgi:hypothetical protein
MTMEPTFSIREMLVTDRIAERLREAEQHRVARRVRHTSEVKRWWLRKRFVKAWSSQRAAWVRPAA